MRLMLDTCVIIDLLTDVDSLSKGALDLLGDKENTLYASAESMRELVVHFNTKKLLTNVFYTFWIREIIRKLSRSFVPAVASYMGLFSSTKILMTFKLIYTFQGHCKIS